MEKTLYVVAAVFLLELIVPVVITHYLKRMLEKRDKKQDEKEKSRVEYEKINLEVTNATAKLSYALAMAIKRGSPNGEVEAGIQAYNEAMEKQNKFMQAQALYNLK